MTGVGAPTSAAALSAGTHAPFHRIASNSADPQAASQSHGAGISGTLLAPLRHVHEPSTTRLRPDESFRSAATMEADRAARRALVIEPHEGRRFIIKRLLTGSGFAVSLANQNDDTASLSSGGHFDLFVCPLQSSDPLKVADWTHWLRKLHPRVAILFVDNRDNSFLGKAVLRASDDFPAPARTSMLRLPFVPSELVALATGLTSTDTPTQAN
jgi:hypothetical protein